MDSLGGTIKKLREEKGLPLRVVSANLNIDQAILSKIERGHRKASRELVTKLAAFFNISENDLIVSWLYDKIMYEIAEEELALQALQLAEEKINYAVFKKINREDIKKQMVAAISKFDKINMAWIYGSFSRGDDEPKSDIDIAIKTDENFNYLDLAEVQHQLEKLIKRKVDIWFIDSFKPYIFEHVKPDLKLIYERQTS